MTSAEPGPPPGGRRRRNLATVRRRLRGMRGRSRYPHLRVTFAVLVVVGVAATLIASAFDAGSVDWSQSLSDGLRPLLRRVTLIGESGWLLIGSGAIVLVLLLADWSRGDRRVAAAWAEIAALAGVLFAVVLGANLTVDLVKFLVGRERPLLFGMDGEFAFQPLSYHYTTSSFPSGHATTAAVLMVFIAAAVPLASLLGLALALVVAGSRIMLGEHYPSDVVAALIFGAGYTYFMIFAFAKGRIGFWIDGVRPRARIDALRGVLRSPGGAGRMARGLFVALFGFLMPHTPALRPPPAERTLNGDRTS